ncbi:MAG TPA: hypothetical protein VNX00_08245 [Herbaspirillum sp.]|jgi:hypothetical protein|nr:hypothetical protein [Herbaspirillum sp.]
MKKLLPILFVIYIIPVVSCAIVLIAAIFIKSLLNRGSYSWEAIDWKLLFVNGTLLAIVFGVIAVIQLNSQKSVGAKKYEDGSLIHKQPPTSNLEDQNLSPKKNHENKKEKFYV